MLYELAKQRFPNEALPHRDIFLAAPPEKLGPKVAEVLKPTVLNYLVPEHVGRNWKSLQALAKAEVVTSTPGGRGDVMDQLVDLYHRAATPPTTRGTRSAPTGSSTSGTTSPSIRRRKRNGSTSPATGR